MKFKDGATVLLTVLLASPVATLLIANLAGVQPWQDNLIMYFLFLLTFGAAALATLAYFLWQNIRQDLWDFIAYALVGAAGAAAFTTLLDAVDDYFTPRGIGWYLTGFGILFGASFGASFRIVCALIARLRQTE